MKKSIHSPESSILREELRAIREAATLSQRELASRLRVPHSWIAKVEIGERRIDVVEFCRFVAACGASPPEVLQRVVEGIQGTSPATSKRKGRRQ